MRPALSDEIARFLIQAERPFQIAPAVTGPAKTQACAGEIAICGRLPGLVARASGRGQRRRTEIRLTTTRKPNRVSGRSHAQ
jgi:hypothetical protein